MIDISFNSQTKPIDISLQSTSELGIGFSSGVAIQGSIVIPNPETEPTDDLETIKINSETFRIKDGQLADWAREETKPTYTAPEVGAVDQENILSFDEIDRLVDAVFG